MMLQNYEKWNQNGSKIKNNLEKHESSIQTTNAKIYENKVGSAGCGGPWGGVQIKKKPAVGN